MGHPVYRTKLDAVTLEENYLYTSIICCIYFFLRYSKMIGEHVGVEFGHIPFKETAAASLYP